MSRPPHVAPATAGAATPGGGAKAARGATLPRLGPAPRALGAAFVVLLGYRLCVQLTGVPLWQHAAAEALGFGMVALALLQAPGQLDGAATRRSLVQAVRLMAVVLPAWCLARSAYFGATTYVAAPELQHCWRPVLAAIWTHVMAVALPEELFWRGYLQPALARRWPAKYRLFGAPFGAAACVANALFAASHVAGGAGPASLATFFPGLIFAWLQARHGSVAGAWASHAACNLVATLADARLPYLPP